MRQIKRMILAGFIMLVIILSPLSVKAAEDIPGIHSSLLKYNAEKNAVPTILNIVTERGEKVYGSYTQEEEKLVRSNTMNEENVREEGKVAQISKVVVWIGVLFCIGMLFFLILF